jgi:hypothetical protein
MNLPVTSLTLDAVNPRLPEGLHNAPENELFGYLYDNGVLDELAESMLDNGFFEHEPLIVLASGVGNQYVVVEGNRRLAALMLVHGLPPAEGRLLPERPTVEQLERLKDIPVVEVHDREEVRRFLGYRHISGLKPWKPEAKARYIVSEVESAVQEGVENPFSFVSRRVGSNSQGVRNSYMALVMLQHARTECGADVLHVLNERFGVWLRCMNSQEIKKYLGLNSPRNYKEVVSAVNSLDCARLVEVIGDLSPSTGRPKPLLADSRDVTQYGLVLQSENARSMMRKYGDLEIAKQVVVNQNLPSRINELKRRLDMLREEIQENLESVSSELSVATDDLVRSARLLQGAVTALNEND